MCLKDNALMLTIIEWHFFELASFKCNLINGFDELKHDE